MSAAAVKIKVSSTAGLSPSCRWSQRVQGNVTVSQAAYLVGCMVTVVRGTVLMSCSMYVLLFQRFSSWLCQVKGRSCRT